MKKLIINNGQFTANGNFTGYTAKGVQVHIFKRQMEALGFSSIEKVKLPFFVIAEPKDYPARVDANGNPVGQPIIGRLTAMSVFATDAAIIDAFVQETTLDARIEKAVSDARKSYNLDNQQVEDLTNASVAGF